MFDMGELKEVLVIFASSEVLQRRSRKEWVHNIKHNSHYNELHFTHSCFNKTNFLLKAAGFWDVPP
jgi:hypothetical protein